MKVFIDLFSGLGGAASAFDEDPSWHVIKIDNNRELLEHNRGLQIMDISDTQEVIRMLESQFQNGCHLNCDKLVIWASPPCQEFSWARADRRQGQTAEEFDMTLLESTRQIIEYFQPEIWIIENVHGAKPIFNEELELNPRQEIGSIVLWGEFPLIGIRTRDDWMHRKLEAKGSRTLRPNNRAIIPYAVSEGLRLAIDEQKTLFDF